MTSPNRPRILVAEDETLVAEMIRGLLTDMGYEVAATATDGQQAVELTCATRPDAILMDIQMPVMDGITATRRIYSVCPTPVVILTAYDSRETVDQASDAGVGAFLVKPPNPRELERAIVIATARFEDMMALRRINAELKDALAKVKTLSGMLPICSSCKKIRNDKGYWQQVAEYIRDHSEVEFTHSICPECARKLYPELLKTPLPRHGGGSD